MCFDTIDNHSCSAVLVGIENAGHYLWELIKKSSLLLINETVLSIFVSCFQALIAVFHYKPHSKIAKDVNYV